MAEHRREVDHLLSRLTPREAVTLLVSERDRYREELCEAHLWLKAEGMCDCEYFEGVGHKLCRFAEACDG